MKFILGLLTGIILGALAAVAYSVQTGRDLREEYAGVRSDLSRRDLDALGARLESRVSEMQAILEARVNEVRERANTAAGQAADVAIEAADAAGETAEAVVETAEEAKPEA